MNRLGIVTYNIYCSFTNYGSALQTWALQRAVDLVCDGRVEPLCVDYCPDAHIGSDPLNPLERMWDTDRESRHQLELSMPAIRTNFDKFDAFYRERCSFSRRAYTSANVGESWEDEGLSGYVCGSDTIFCIREFKGFDAGYYADVPQMTGRAVAYAASFGDVDWKPDELDMLSKKLTNFRAVGLREGAMVGFCRNHADVPVERVADPTLLLRQGDYLAIAAPRQHEAPYVLLYSRRYDPAMEAYAERLACERGCDVVEISLRATNADLGHDMRYDAGVEEYLALVRDAEYVVTNSYHGLAFALQMHTPFTVFTREQAGSKISELLDWVGLSDRAASSADCDVWPEMRFEDVDARLAAIREHSLSFLRTELGLLGVL